VTRTAAMALTVATPAQMPERTPAQTPVQMLPVMPRRLVVPMLPPTLPQPRRRSAPEV